MGVLGVCGVCELVWDPVVCWWWCGCGGSVLGERTGKGYRGRVLCSVSGKVYDPLGKHREQVRGG